MSDLNNIKLDQQSFRAIVPPLSRDLHKGQGGRVGILGGSSDYTGAPFFSGMSALRLGADLCHIICDEDAATAIKSYSPDLIVHPYIRVRAMKNAGNTSAVEPILTQTQNDIESLLKRIHVLVVGPGLSRDALMLGIARFAIQKARQLDMPIVIDADGLFLIQNKPDVIQGYHKAVLTPNLMEFGRLCEAQDIDTKNKDTCNPPVQQLSKKLGVVIIEKGKDDYISDGQKTMVVGNPGGLKRSGGQGDILTGLLATSLAWGIAYRKDVWQHSKELSEQDVFLAACTGACALNRECSRLAFEKHQRAMQSSDVIHEIGPMFNRFYEEKKPISGCTSSAHSSSIKWVPDVPLADAVKVTKKPRLSNSAKGTKESTHKNTKLLTTKQDLQRWTLPCHQQKHDDRPHQDAVMTGVPELRSMIAEHLTLQDLATIVRVCQEWNHCWIVYLYQRVNLNKLKLLTGVHMLPFHIHGPVVRSLSLSNYTDNEVDKVFQHDFPNLREVDLTAHSFTSSKTFRTVLKSISPSISRLRLSCRSSSYYVKDFSRKVFPVLSIVPERFRDLEELVLDECMCCSLGFVMLILKNMSRLRVLKLTSFRSYRFLDQKDPHDKYSDVPLSGEEWKHPTLETVTISLNMIGVVSQRQAGDISINKLQCLTAFFEKVPNVRHLTIEVKEVGVESTDWHNGVLRHLPSLESLTVNVTSGNSSDLCDKLHEYCPHLTSFRMNRSPYRLASAATATIKQLPPGLETLDLTNVMLEELELKQFVEQSTPKAMAQGSSATAGCARLPIPSNSSLLSAPDTLCHTLRWLNLEYCKGITPSTMLYVLEHCSQLECLNLRETNAGTLDLFEEGRPWACAKTLKALSMDLIRVRQTSSTNNSTNTTNTNDTGSLFGGFNFLPFFPINQPEAQPLKFFTVHDLRKIRKRLLSLENLRALRLKGNLTRLTVISRGDYKPSDELYTLDQRKQSGSEQQDNSEAYGAPSEGGTSTMEINTENRLTDDEDDEDDIKLRRERNASILERLEWAKIDVEMSDIQAEYSAAHGRDGSGGAGGQGDVHQQFHPPPFHLQNVISRLESWEAHHHDLVDVWYDYSVPRQRHVPHIFQFCKEDPTGWMVDNLASGQPFPL
ncbi:hypothetical protein BGW41_003771 [Actinomortierella wolfii]|nr:hypothetical protein BGW41_003771 [Actinomortierella wolfii]